MREGKFEDGSKVLRAKIDMSSSNINMRDPVIYRIARIHHHNTGDDWCIYPMYDFAHPIEDAGSSPPSLSTTVNSKALTISSVDCGRQAVSAALIAHWPSASSSNFTPGPLSSSSSPPRF